MSKRLRSIILLYIKLLNLRYYCNVLNLLDKDYSLVNVLNLDNEINNLFLNVLSTLKEDECRDQ